MSVKKRVVVTGLGVISPVGNQVQVAWDAMLAGRSGIKVHPGLEAEQHSVKIAGLVDDFNCEAYGITKKDARKMDMFMQYGIAAADQAISDANLASLNETQRLRTGVAIGSGIGGLTTIEQNAMTFEHKGAKKLSPFFIPGSIVNLCAGHVAIRHGYKGPNLAMATACTTGAHSIGLAMRAIQYGDADIMLAGGAECASSPLGIGGFAAMKALSTRNDAPELASRPFDRDRDGFVLGDGASVLVIESLDSAEARGARIYAEIVGFGMSADAHHMTAPSIEGPARAMQIAMHDAGISAEQLDYVNAHGTSTPVGDINETNAIKHALGDAASSVMISSTKSMTGHLLGAAGALEAMVSVLAVHHNVIPPTINLDNPSDECDLDYVPNTARETKVEYSLSNSFGFGGTNGSLLFKGI